MNGGGGGASSCGSCLAEACSGGGGKALSGEVAPVLGRLVVLSGCDLSGERPGELGEETPGAGERFLDNDSGTSKPYLCLGGRGLIGRKDGESLEPKTPKLVLRA